MLFTKILTFLSGGILDRVFSHLEKREEYKNADSRIKAEIVKEAISAEMAGRKAAAEIIKVEQGSFLASMVRPLFVYPLIVYWMLIIVDSIGNYSWDVLALPEPMATWSTWMVGSYFVSRPIEKMVRGFIHKR